MRSLLEEKKMEHQLDLDRRKCDRVTQFLNSFMKHISVTDLYQVSEVVEVVGQDGVKKTERRFSLEEGEYDYLVDVLNGFMEYSSVIVNREPRIVTYDIPSIRLTFNLDDKNLIKVKFETLEV